MSFPPAFLDELRNRTTLSALIGQDVKLTRAGREFKACCPFHNEKSPSFYVNDEKTMYHCFGCAAHGDAIRWMTDMKGMGFRDAVAELAARAGLDLPVESARSQQQRDDREPMYEIMARAQRWFAEQLASPAGEQARMYLAGRRISAEQQRIFGLGFAGDSRKGQSSALKAALSGVEPSQLVTLGLMRQRDDEAPYDYFRNRLMIPIYDARGRVIGFGGRIIGQGEPKYLNSPETPLFDKGRSLYNVHRAAVDARKAKRVVVVEGYLDVIGMSAAGVGEVVATNGTALTEQQMVLAWRMADEPILCFDGDGAGQSAARKAAIRALPGLEAGRSFSFAFPPTGQDPFDVAMSAGSVGTAQMLERRSSLVDVLWNTELLQTGLSTPERRAAFRKALADYVSTINDARVRDEYAREIRRRIEALEPDTPRSSTRNSRSSRNFIDPRPSDAAKKIAQRGNRWKVEAAALAGLLMHPQTLPSLSEAIATAEFLDQDLNRLASALITAGYSGAHDAAALERLLADENLVETASAVRAFPHLPFAFLRPGNSDAETALNLILTALARP